MSFRSIALCAGILLFQQILTFGLNSNAPRLEEKSDEYGGLTQQPQPPSSGQEASRETSTGSDGGSDVLPPAGILPAGVSAEAAALWRRFAEAQAVPGRPPGPLPSFDIEFALRVREGAQSNDLRAQVRYLGPGFVRFGPSGRAELMRGPRGDFLVDGAESVALRGREYAEDRRQLDQALILARTFAALADTSQLRIASLTLMERPPDRLPARVGFRPLRLTWLELVTPDLSLFEPQAQRPGQTPALQRARLGLDIDPEGLPRLRCLELSPIGEPDPLGPLPLERVVLLENSRVLDGRLVPGALIVFERGGPPPEGLTWEEISADPQLLRHWSMPRPTQEIYLERGNLRPGLQPRDFEP